MNVAKRSLLMFFLLALSISCLDDPECFALNNNVIGVTFRSLTDGKTTSVSISNVTAENAADTLLIDAVGSRILLPLNFYTSQSRYHVQTTDSSYLIVLDYTVQTQFVSKDCGERFIISDLTVSEHTFDSVRVIGTTPGVNDKANNIEIFWE